MLLIPLVVGLDDDLAELLRVAQPPQRGHVVLEPLRLGRRVLADLAGGHLDVLLADRGIRTASVVRLRALSFCGSSQIRIP